MAAQPNFWGSLIIRLRMEQGISQRQLANRSRVDRSTLRRIEDGGMYGNINVMERLLDYLGYELEALEKTSVTERLKAQGEIESNPIKRSKIALARILAM